MDFVPLTLMNIYYNPESSNSQALLLDILLSEVFIMKEKQIKVLKVAPGKLPEMVVLNNDLRSLQEAVSIGADYVGLIEIIELEKEACLLCNEEGKLNGLEPNRRLGNDIICGTFYITGQDKEGNLASLPHAMMEKYSHRFLELEYYSEEDVVKATVMRFFTW